MTGHEPIVAMRRRGKAPKTVVVMFDPKLVNRDWHETDPRIAYVALAPKDRPARLDFRSLVGLPVVVLGDVGDPVKATVDAVLSAGASAVSAAICECEGGDCFRVVESFDSGRRQWLAS